MNRSAPLKRGKPLKRGRPKKRPSLKGFHEAVIARAGGRCELESSECFGRLWGHHVWPKARLKDNPAAYVDDRAGVALCLTHHAMVHGGQVGCPRPPEMSEFLADYGLYERKAA